MMSDQLYVGKRVLVTGASSGIGATTARVLGNGGAHMAVHYHHNAETAEAIAQEIRSNGGQAEVFQCDLMNRSARSALIPNVVKALGGLDALINNAGTPQGIRPFVELTALEWEQTLALNAEAPFFLSQSAFIYMRDHGGGRIINVSSVGVKYGGSEQTMHYVAAKAALEILTIGLAKLGAPHNILVNTVRAGVIETPFWQTRPRDEVEARIQKIPLRRAGRPEEIAAMIAYLLSAEAAFITGQTFTISGGD